MKDQALESVWNSRKNISRKCGFDPRRLVKYIQQHGKEKNLNKANALGAYSSHQ